MYVGKPISKCLVIQQNSDVIEKNSRMTYTKKKTKKNKTMSSGSVNHSCTYDIFSVYKIFLKNFEFVVLIIHNIWPKGE